MKFLKNDELGRPGNREFSKQVKLPVTVVLDNVRSGMNVGSVFRSADSFLVEKIILCGITAQPPEREILKTALGATETVAWEYIDETARAIKSLKDERYFIYAIEQSDQATFLQDMVPVPDKRYALVFGNEVRGVNDHLIPLLDGCIEIPQSGTKHSLNIAVAAGLVLWKFYDVLHLKA